MRSIDIEKMLMKQWLTLNEVLDGLQHPRLYKQAQVVINAIDETEKKWNEIRALRGKNE